MHRSLSNWKGATVSDLFAPNKHHTLPSPIKLLSQTNHSGIRNRIPKVCKAANKFQKSQL